MSLITAQHPVRIARPSRDLAAAQRFWCGGLGLEVLWRTGPEATGGHALLMVGAPSAPWHLELVGDAAALAERPPGPEDLLVVYLGTPVREGDLDRVVEHGGRVVAARNPYWDEHGVTIEDPDGYRLVLCRRTWG